MSPVQTTTRRDARRRSPRGEPERVGRSAVPSARERMLPLPELLAAEALVCVGIAVGWSLGEPWWVGVLAGAVLAAVLVMPVRGRSLPRWLGARLAFWSRRRRGARSRTRGTDATDRPYPVDVEQPDGSQIGFDWDGRVLVSLIRIEENPQALTVLEPGATVSGETVPVAVIAECLRQYDIAVDSIDVFGHGSRSRGRGHVAAVYDAVLGPLPAIAHRSTWVAVRVDPARCPDAVDGRGGGWEGALRTAGVATRRVANRLSESGLSSRPCSAAEMAGAVTELSAGVGPARLEETWSDCRWGRLALRSYAVPPQRCTTGGLGAAWKLPSHATTVTLSLRRAPEGDAVMLRGLVRVDVPVRARSTAPGLSLLTGSQLGALVSGLPVPAPRRAVGVWAEAPGGRIPADLVLPVAGCGQVIGADEYGRAIALPLFGPRVARVELYGTLHLAQQVVLRSLALGARVLVHSRRAAAWRSMVEQVGDPDQLRVSAPDRGSRQAGTNREYTVEMFDGEPERPVRVGVTEMVVLPTDSSSGRAADVVLRLVDPERDVVQVSTRAGSARVTMVASDDELRYIGASLDLVG